MSYATFSDFEQFLEGFGTNYYGTMVETVGTVAIDLSSWQAAIDSSYNRINILLDSVARIPIVPIGTSPKNGSYHPWLIEWNACDVIFNKLRARHLSEYGKVPEWIYDFATRCQNIWSDILNERIVFDTDVTNSGIGYPVQIAGDGYGSFQSNWNFGFYTASDYPKDFRFKITNVDDGKNIGQAKFQYSEDGGVSFYSDLLASGTSWIDIKDGLQVRWQPGTQTGTIGQLPLNSEWSVQCNPTQIRTSNSESRYRTFPLG